MILGKILIRTWRKYIVGLAWTRDHFPRDDFHPTIEFIMTAFSCQENTSSNIVQRNKDLIIIRNNSLLWISFLLLFSGIQLSTLISTSSKMMQLISLTPAPTRTFAEIDTLGPICSKKWQNFQMKGVRELEARKFKAVKYRDSCIAASLKKFS